MRQEDVLRRAPGTQAVAVGDERLVYDGELLTLLTGSSALIWQHVDGVRTVQEIVDELCRRHPDADQVGPDVLTFLAKVAADGLLVTRDGLAGPRYKRPEHVGWVRDGRVCLLVHFESGARRALSASGSRIWELVCEHGALEPVLSALREEYPDAPEGLHDQVLALLEQLVAEDLLVCYA